MSELFDAVDALVASRSPLPPPTERRRLRQAHALTLDEVAAALDVRRATVGGWESGRTEPRPPEREAYARLLKQLAQLYPASESTGGPQEDTDTAAARTVTPAAPAARPQPTGGAPEAAAAPVAEEPPAAPPAAVGAPAAVSLPHAERALGPRRPAVKKAAPTNTPTPGGAYAHGPLLVLDADSDRQVTGYGVGGLIVDVPAKSLPALVEWTLTEAQLGAERLHGSGKDADPLLVLTEAACERYGLPAALSESERLAGRLPEGHKVIRQLERADWQLTKRGLGPWARIYRPAQAGRRQCVQLCIPSWRALDGRAWGHAAQLEPAELARVLGVYAARVMTPVGSTAVTGLQLMTTLNPPTRASEPDESGRRHRELRPGSLGTEPLDPAPCEATDGHPVLAHLPRFHVRGPDERLFEEAYDWARDLTDAECMQRYLVGLDVNLAFGAAANGAVVGLATPPVHVTRPVFDAAVPGSWLVDLSHVDLGRVKVAKQWCDLDAALLPSPFTPTGQRPEGPAWYATPTVAYAVELGYDVAPLEGWVRRESGRFLDGWYKRLRDAYVATMADLGVAEKLSPADFLKAMDGYKSRDPALGIVVDAVKMTVKGGIGKLQEKARGGGWKPGQAWPALARPTWRPDIRATVISRARINMHRKMLNLAAATGRYPVAVLSDCAVYAADGPSPLDVLPYGADGKTAPGSFRLGVSPGMVKHEGTQSMLWGADVLEQLGADGHVANLARYIKTGEVTAKDTGE
ncbi:telomere-associated protein Tap [Streptomyces scabiei]|uniref:telomere-associated protein Tap n=1 Tax=Streptomyces scabiei TaxID=1930 RepID=UPI0029A4E388|nr:helix-turn-helix transcriptional regulator [Streptomyces scabiei]MDX2540044.1 helix-turn-helix transcriptional regulator [Streptomyces scabiei]MDX2802359.1 helix-turn-helix transcriptional regulator [Streptomyces scabiei]MDX2858491.1 helix-turn-helix transcriptional regulator [Streptomyces scabiei]MDX3279335.1 helix-turn-helix transcriptional regulator [Streptomyces scabiei]MDX3830469.1 helix-turn-helix transcriptional regulator [Streptomyces scabiei]